MHSADSGNSLQTEKDFAEIAGAGLNWIRLPIPYWAIEVFDGEPFLEGVAWKSVSLLFLLPGHILIGTAFPDTF